jgi:hypothetical protein
MTTTFTLPIVNIVCNSILQIEVLVPSEVLDQLDIPDQTPVEHHHITLIRLDDLGVDPASLVLPPWPSDVTTIDINLDLFRVQKEAKIAYYLEVSPKSVETIQQYLDQVRSWNPCISTDPKRVFHTSLCNNGGGNVRGSVGDPWNYQPQFVGELATVARTPEPSMHA